MKLLELITEARKKQLSKEYLEKLSKNENVFVHFSDLEKLGVNPRYTYDTTPVGIYTYPLYLVWEKYNKRLENLPFASDRNFVFVIFLKSSAKKILTREKISSDHIKKIKEYFEKKFTKDDYIQGKLQTNVHAKEKISQRIIKRFKIFWESPSFYNYSDLINTIKNTFLEYNLKPEHMTYFYRKILDVDVIVDDGTGAIHGNEPIQAVIMNYLAIEKYEIFENSAKFEKIKDDLYHDVWFLKQSPQEALEYDFLAKAHHIIFNTNPVEVLENLKNYLIFYLISKNDPKYERKYDNYMNKFKKIFAKISSEKNYLMKLKIIGESINFDKFFENLFKFAVKTSFLKFFESDNSNKIGSLFYILKDLNLFDKLIQSFDYEGDFIKKVLSILDPHNVSYTKKEIDGFVSIFDYLEEKGFVFYERLNDHELTKLFNFFGYVYNNYDKNKAKHLVETWIPKLKFLHEIYYFTDKELIEKTLEVFEKFSQSENYFNLIAKKLTKNKK